MANKNANLVEGNMVYNNHKQYFLLYTICQKIENRQNNANQIQSSLQRTYIDTVQTFSQKICFKLKIESPSNRHFGKVYKPSSV